MRHPPKRPRTAGTAGGTARGEWPPLSPTQPNRVTGRLKLRDRRAGAVWYADTRVPGRTPEQTMRRLAPAHVGGGKPRRGSLTRRQAEDALADLLAAERRRVGEGAYAEDLPTASTFGDAADGFLHHVEHVKGREFATVKDYRLDALERWEVGEAGFDSRSIAKA